MKITEDVRKYAAEQKISEEQALQVGLEQKANEFVKKARKFTRRHDLLVQTAANVTSTSPWFIANFQRFRELSEGQRWTR